MSLCHNRAIEVLLLSLYYSGWLLKYVATSFLVYYVSNYNLSVSLPVILILCFKMNFGSVVQLVERILIYKYFLFLHYFLESTNGDDMKLPKLIRPLVIPEVFIGKIFINLKQGGCWNWIKSTREGYGQITVDKVAYGAHRYSYVHFYGEISKDSVVRHMCHNRRCCNPKHLRLGTHKDNWKDSEKAHRRQHCKMMKKCRIGKVSYESVRAAKKATGLAYATLYNYLKNGVFDLKSYRKMCLRKDIVPKV